MIELKGEIDKFTNMFATSMPLSKTYITTKQKISKCIELNTNNQAIVDIYRIIYST